MPQPISGALVGQEETEAARPRGLPRPVLAVRDGAGAGQDDDPHAVRSPRHERDGGVVDDAHLLAMAEPAEDAADDGLVMGPIHARDAEPHRGDRAPLGQGLHDIVEDLLHLELTMGLEVRPAPPLLGQHLARLVREQPDRLGPARVDPDHVAHGCQV